MLERGEVEIGVTDFYATSERAEVSDLSVILDYAEYEWTAIESCFLNHKFTLYAIAIEIIMPIDLTSTFHTHLVV